MGIAKEIVYRCITALILGIILFGTLLFLPPRYFSLLLGIIGALCALEVYRLLPVKRYAPAVLVVYPLASFLLLMYLNHTARSLLLFSFIAVFIFDTGAYMIGSLIGRHKIAPMVSPKKSWEGFFGGYASLFVFMIILARLHNSSLSMTTIAMLAFTLSFMATVGDLGESYLKRKAGVKDSGNLLPGHGGFLDRFDAIIAVAPFVYCVRELLILLFL